MSPWRGIRSALPLVALSLLGACTRSARIDALPRPTFMVEHVWAVCSSHDVVDGQGQAWHESGCEDGKPGNVVSATRKLSEAERRELAALFDALPKAPACTPTYGTLTLVREEGPTHVTTWELCTIDNAGHVAEPFERAAAAVKRAAAP